VLECSIRPTLVPQAEDFSVSHDTIERMPIAALGWSFLRQQ
jgi:hypothetical protein